MGPDRSPDAPSIVEGPRPDDLHDATATIADALGKPRNREALRAAMHRGIGMHYMFQSENGPRTPAKQQRITEEYAVAEQLVDAALDGEGDDTTAAEFFDQLRLAQATPNHLMPALKIRESDARRAIERLAPGVLAMALMKEDGVPIDPETEKDFVVTSYTRKPLLKLESVMNGKQPNPREAEFIALAKKPGPTPEDDKLIVFEGARLLIVRALNERASQNGAPDTIPFVRPEYDRE